MKFFLLIFFIFSCQTDPFQRGINQNYDFYLPANVVFLPIFDLEGSSKNSKEIKELLHQLDEEILRAFINQTFIQGFSQKLVVKTLHDKKKKPPEVSLEKFINQKETFLSFLKFYEEHLKNKTEWLLFLNELSIAFNFSDAVFLPVMTKIAERKQNDRGLQISSRSLELSLLLIEVETGEPIWYETRNLTLSHKDFPSPPAFAYPEYPSWKNFEKKLIVENLWRDFPGWQY